VPLRAWGENGNGQLGTGTLHSAKLPVKVSLPTGVTITQVRTGCTDTVALTSAGQVYAWGQNNKGQLGDGTTATRTTPVRVQLPAGVKATAVRAGCRDNLALTSKGRVYAWGNNANGELGDGTHHNRHKPVPVKLPTGATVKAISAGCDHALAITSSGGLLAWGYNGAGQVGDGTMKSRAKPVHVKLPTGATTTIVAAGCSHSIALTSAGLFGWGLNTNGQLGNGTMQSSDAPVPIIILRRGPPLGSVVALFAGCYHTLMLFSKGAVLAWGYNGDGQLGNGMTADSDKPVGVQVPTGDTVKSISAGCFDSYALTTTGQVLAWGLGTHGGLGTGNLGNSDVPVPVALPSGLAATAVFAGAPGQHAFALVKES
jgi:alpha-tubulin suppressor-like RCC1 family protein